MHTTSQKDGFWEDYSLLPFQLWSMGLEGAAMYNRRRKYNTPLGRVANLSKKALPASSA